MNFTRMTSPIAALLVCLGQGVFAEVLCTFDVRSTVNGTVGLSGDGFRVREVDQVLQLEQLYADGKWHGLGAVQRFDPPGFTVFLHLPTGGSSSGYSLSYSCAHTERRKDLDRKEFFRSGMLALAKEKCRHCRLP